MRNKGFTLIELMIVVVILGILAAIALPNFIRMTENAKRASCTSNQRHIFEAATLYVNDNAIVAATINVNVLNAAGYASQRICECPSSTNPDFDDYTVDIVNSMVSAMTCDVLGAKHLFVPPPK